MRGKRKSKLLRKYENTWLIYFKKYINNIKYMCDLSITKNANISIIYELNKKYTIFFFVQFRPVFVIYSPNRIKKLKKIYKT